jgi:hypothetical protein
MELIPLTNDRLSEILWLKRKGSLLATIDLSKISLEMFPLKTYTLDEFSENQEN